MHTVCSRGNTNTLFSTGKPLCAIMSHKVKNPKLARGKPVD